jgi:Fur family zinc uptake transcriptional regulator
MTCTPAPDLDHLLACAADVCARRGAQLTPLRRAVLGLVIDSERPAGAYDLLSRLSTEADRAAPPTVYRALEFLMAQGLVHKIERLSAYVACVHHLRHDHDHPAHGQSVQFLICVQCGRATELEDTQIQSALAQAAAARGFQMASSTVEAAGVCANCLQGG